jgi:hypothetical protein
MTYEHSSSVENLTGLKLKSAKTIPSLFLALSLYLIFWNIIAHFLKSRALTPPSKADEYEDIP